jgi:signal transduction histidine kinase
MELGTRSPQLERGGATSVSSSPEDSNVHPLDVADLWQQTRAAFRAATGLELALAAPPGTSLLTSDTRGLLSEREMTQVLEVAPTDWSAPRPALYAKRADLLAALRIWQHHVVVCGPLRLHGGAHYGTLTPVADSVLDDLAPEQRSHLSAFATVARLLRTVLHQRAASGRLAARMSVLNTVGEVISREPDMDHAVMDILEMAVALLDAENGSVMLLVEDEPDTLRIAYAKGLPPEVVECVRVRLGEGISGHVAQTGLPVRMRRGEQHTLSSLPDTRWSTAVCVPLRVRDHVVGVLNLRDDTRGTEFSDDDVELAMTFASQAALAIENNRLIGKLTRRVEDVQEEVAEIHDDLARVRERLQNIVHSIPSPVLVTNGQGRVTHVNRAAVEVLRLSPGLVLMRPLEGALVESEVGEALLAAVEKAREGRPAEGEVPEVAIGRPVRRNYQVHVAAVSSERGEAGEVIVLADVTELRELSDLKTEVVSITTHELKTPLTAIVGFARTLQDRGSGVDDTTRGEYLGIILDQAIRLNNLIVNLLDLSKLDSGRALDLRVLDTSVGEMLRSAARGVEASCMLGTHTFDVEVAEDALEARLDRDKIEQVVVNFLTNSVKYADPGVVRVVASREGDELCVSVIDHGRGIAPEEVPHVFERFRRVGDGDHRKQAGHGLGLYLCRAFIESHGGRIGVDSVVGEGSRFFFRVPIGGPVELVG